MKVTIPIIICLVGYVLSPTASQDPTEKCSNEGDQVCVNCITTGKCQGTLGSFTIGEETTCDFESGEYCDNSIKDTFVGVCFRYPTNASTCVACEEHLCIADPNNENFYINCDDISKPLECDPENVIASSCTCSATAEADPSSTPTTTDTTFKSTTSDKLTTTDESTSDKSTTTSKTTDVSTTTERSTSIKSTVTATPNESSTTTTATAMPNESTSTTKTTTPNESTTTTTATTTPNESTITTTATTTPNESTTTTTATTTPNESTTTTTATTTPNESTTTTTATTTPNESTTTTTATTTPNESATTTTVTVTPSESTTTTETITPNESTTTTTATTTPNESTTTTTATTTPPEIICPDDCPFADDPTSCEGYYQCTTNGDPIRFFCPATFCFNQEACQCLPGGSTTPVTCPDDCPFVDDPNDDCSSYFACISGGDPIQYTCPSPRCFDQESCGCIETSSKTPTTSTTSSVATTTSTATTTTTSRTSTALTCPPGCPFVEIPDEDCQNFYICSNGELVPSQCPGNLCFDQNQCECVL